MEQAKLDAAAVSATVEETEAIFAKESKDPGTTLPEDEPDTAEPPAKVPKRDKPRMSKRARKQSKEGTVGDDGDFDVKVVGGESNSKRESVGHWIKVCGEICFVVSFDVKIQGAVSANRSLLDRKSKSSPKPSCRDS